MVHFFYHSIVLSFIIIKTKHSRIQNCIENMFRCIEPSSSLKKSRKVKTSMIFMKHWRWWCFLEPNSQSNSTSNAAPTSIPNSAQFEKKRLLNVEQRLRAAVSEIESKNKEIANLRLQLKRVQSSSTNLGVTMAWTESTATNKPPPKVESRLTPRG